MVEVNLHGRLADISDGARDNPAVRTHQRNNIPLHNQIFAELPVDHKRLLRQLDDHRRIVFPVPFRRGERKRKFAFRLQPVHSCLEFLEQPAGAMYVTQRPLLSAFIGNLSVHHQLVDQFNDLVFFNFHNIKIKILPSCGKRAQS